MLIWQIHFSLFENFSHLFPEEWLYWFTILPTVNEGSSLSPHPCQHLLAILTVAGRNLKIVSIFIFLIYKDDEHLLRYFLAILISSFENSLFRPIVQFLIGPFVFLTFLSFYVFIYFGYQSSVRYIVAKYCLSFCAVLLHLIVSFDVQKVFNFMRSHLLIVII